MKYLKIVINLTLETPALYFHVIKIIPLIP